MRNDLVATVRAVGRNVRAHPRLAALSLLSIFIGLVLAIVGIAWAALVIAAGIGLSGLVDRRLPIVLFIVVLPGSNQFHALPAFRIAGSTVDFRLLMTAAVGAVLAAQVLMLRPRFDPLSVAFASFVGFLVLAAPLNEYAPLRSLPPIGRAVDGLLAYLVARSVVRSAGDALLVAVAIVTAMLPVAGSAIVQLIAGEALIMNDAARLSGVYRTGTVGLGMAMQIGMFVLWGVVLWTARRRLVLAVAALTFALLAFVMVETASRLVFVTGVLGLVTFELWRKRLAMAAGVVVVGAIVLLAQPQLAGRLASTVETDSPSNSSGRVDDEEGLPGDASLQYRIYLWNAMLPEWIESPLVGRGTGSFAVLFERQGGQRREAPHNDYVGILVETGVVGVTLYVALQATALLMTAFRARIFVSLARNLAMAAAITYLSINVLSALNNPIYYVDLQTVIWSLLGAAIAVSAVQSPASPIVVQLRAPASGPLGVISDLAHALRLAWRHRASVLVASRRSTGYRLAGAVAAARVDAEPSGT